MQDCPPLFIIYLRQVAEWERERGENHIFRSAGRIQSHHVDSLKGKEKSKKKGKNSWIPLIAAQRDTRILHFFFWVSVFRLYKYQPGPLQSLWAFMAVEGSVKEGGRRENLIGLIKHYHCHIDRVLSTGWLAWTASASISQTSGSSADAEDWLRKRLLRNIHTGIFPLRFADEGR